MTRGRVREALGSLASTASACQFLYQNKTDGHTLAISNQTKRGRVV